MRRRRAIPTVAWLSRSAPPLAALLVVLAAGAAAPAAADQASPLASRLERALQHRGFRGAKVACLVVRAGDGERLFARSAGENLIPASNAKVLTALGVLSALGPTHRFVTRVYAGRAPDGDGAVPGLAVRGGGDPALTSEEFWRLAADLRRAGLRRIEGDVLLDDSLFDAERWNPAWGDVSARAYHAPVGALAANYGAFAVHVRAAATAGEPPAVNIDPPVPYFRVRNQARTGAPGSATSLAVERRSAAGSEDVIVSGSLPQGREAEVVQRSIGDPLGYAGAVLAMQLDALGISVSGTFRAGPVPQGYRELLAFEGKPLAEITRLFMKYSNNNIAETLLKGLGAARGGQGTWEAGAAALRAELLAAGLPSGGFQLADGSGLARQNRISPEALVGAHRIARRSFAFGPEFLSSLPIAARDGTLARRASRSKDLVRAKTGLLAGAVSLSGFAETPDAGPVVFALLANGYANGDGEAMAAADAFAAALVGTVK